MYVCPMETISHRQKYPNRRAYILAHLELINCILPVKTTPREREILAAFMDKPGERFSPKNRAAVRQELDMKSANLSKAIRELQAKDFLKEKEDGLLEIHPVIIPTEGEQKYILTYAFVQEEVQAYQEEDSERD